MAKATPNLALLYSGGAGNSNPNASIGGLASNVAAKYAHSQTYTPSTIPGITITHAARNPEGSGTLSYTASNNSVTWLNPLGVSSTIVITDQEWIALGFTESGWLRLQIDTGSLPMSDQMQSIAVAQADYTLFHRPSSTELTSGITDYRALYLWNQSGGTLTAVNLVLTDAAPQSLVQVGSTYNSLSQYFTPSEDGLDFRLTNANNCSAPYTSSLSPLYGREKLLSRTLIGTPAMSYFPPDFQQDSNGVDEDVEILLQDSYDSTGKLSLVEWGTALYWSVIRPGRMVSFWVKRVVPPNPTLPTTEKALFDITFTLS